MGRLLSSTEARVMNLNDIIGRDSGSKSNRMALRRRVLVGLSLGCFTSNEIF